MAYFFFSFFLRDLLLHMLPIGAEMGNMPLSSTLDMSNMYSSGSIGVSESEPIANVSTLSLTSSSMLSVDVPMSLVILSILTPGLDAIDMGMLAMKADSSMILPMMNTGSLPMPLILMVIPSIPGGETIDIDVSNL